MVGVWTVVVAHASQSQFIVLGHSSGLIYSHGSGVNASENAAINCELRTLNSRGQGFGLFAHLGGAFELVPVEGLAVNGALEGLGQHDGEDLAVGEALQPDME